MTVTPHAADIATPDFEAQVLTRSHEVPVLVDFWAGWCAPCRSLKPVLEKLAQEYQGKFFLAKVDTDREQRLARQYDIRSLPTVKLFRNGQQVDGFMGALPERAVRALLDKYVARESDVLVTQAEHAQQEGDGTRAVALLTQALADDPANDRARLALARYALNRAQSVEAEALLKGLSIETRDGPEATTLRAELAFARLLEGAPAPAVLEQRLAANPSDNEAALLLGAYRVLAGQYEPAMQALLGIVHRDRKFGDDAGRKTLLNLFQLLGANHELVKAYRPRLANALN